MLEPQVYSPVKHRYELATRFVSTSGPTQILDIGGYRSREKIVSSFLSNVMYESLNVGPAWYQGEVSDRLYDGISSGQQAHSIDYVISVDTLEHVPRDHRSAFMREAVRIARKRCVIVAPFAPEWNTVSEERRLLDFSSEHGIEPMPSLLEHELLGLPTLGEIESAIVGLDVAYELIPATPRTEYWHGQMAMLYNTVALGESANAVNRKVQEVQEDWLHRHALCHSFAEAYRVIAVIDPHSGKHG